MTHRFLPSSCSGLGVVGSRSLQDSQGLRQRTTSCRACVTAAWCDVQDTAMRSMCHVHGRMVYRTSTIPSCNTTRHSRFPADGIPLPKPVELLLWHWLPLHCVLYLGCRCTCFNCMNAGTDTCFQASLAPVAGALLSQCRQHVTRKRCAMPRKLCWCGCHRRQALLLKHHVHNNASARRNNEFCRPCTSVLYLSRSCEHRPCSTHPSALAPTSASGAHRGIASHRIIPQVDDLYMYQRRCSTPLNSGFFVGCLSASSLPTAVLAQALACPFLQLYSAKTIFRLCLAR